MPRPNNPLPEFLGPRQLYRHILRECSYLPPAWRNHILYTIRSRFRQHEKYDPRLWKHRAEAYQVLGTLRSANSGDKKSMQRFVNKAFARAGPRRRNLIRQLVLPDSPNDSAALEALLQEDKTPKASSESSPDSTAKPAKRSKNAFHSKWDKEKILQFLRSQQTKAKEQPHIWIGGPIKSLREDADVPETTIWGTPPSEALIATKTGKFWKKMVTKIMPPLHKHEWEMIGRLSAGAQDTEQKWMIPKRRTPAKPVKDDGTNNLHWDWAGYANHGVHYVERQKASKNSRRTGQEDGNPYQKPIPAQVIKPRWYRRVYSRLWQTTPIVEQDPHSLKRKITWGSFQSTIQPAREWQLEFFEGVNDDLKPAYRRNKAKEQLQKAKERTRNESSRQKGSKEGA